MKREYTYTVHVIVEDGDVLDWWTDGGEFAIGEFCAAAVADYNDKAKAAAEEAADMALQARKERQA